MDTRNEIREFLTSRRARITPEMAGLPWYGAEAGSKSQEALNLLASWTASIDEEISDADHEERDRHGSGAE